jgi:hypothetical protein
MKKNAAKPAPDPPRWYTATEAGQVIGCPARQIPRLAEAGAITVKRLPGVSGRPLYLKADVERVARESVQRAKTASA